jgi:hypothetical protein
VRTLEQQDAGARRRPEGHHEAGERARRRGDQRAASGGQSGAGTRVEGEKALERQALTILVGRARLEQKAADLGVQVSSEEVFKRVGAGSTAASEQEGNANFVASQARAQLLYEKLFAQVTAGIKVTDAEARRYYEQHRALYGSQTFGQVREGIRSRLLGERRNAAMKRGSRR